MKTNRSFRGIAWWAGAAAATALGLVACGSDFSGGDCKASRTCPATGGDSAADGGAPSGNATNAGGTDGTAAGQGGGADVTTPDVAGGAGGATALVDAGGAGGAPEPECRVAKDCSNNDPTDGEEVCKGGSCAAGNPPPTVVSVTPVDKATSVATDGSVVIEFSEPLDPKTAIPANVQVLDGAIPVDGDVSYADKKVTFKPKVILGLLTPYTVSVSVKVTDADGAALLAPFKSTFTVRDGTWKTTIDAVKGSYGHLANALPMASDGRVLLAWSGTPSDYCPVSGRWFLRGVGTDESSFAVAGDGDCNNVSSAGNAAGEAAVLWNEPGGATNVELFRGGAWQAMPTSIPSIYGLAPAVAPNGVVTFFDDQGVGVKAWTTDAAANWPSQGDAISSFEAEGRTSVSFDSKGNGFAVWRAIDSNGTKLERIVSSSLTTTSGKWGQAQDLAGSVTATASATPQRGVPVVAMDDKAGAMVLWSDVLTGKLMAARYAAATGWAASESISGAPVIDISHEAPSLVFDGKAFIAAWTAKEAGVYYTYSARCDLDTGWGVYKRHQMQPADGTSAARMPRLATDGRGHLMLVYATGSAPNFKLKYQRYLNDDWGLIAEIPGGAVSSTSFEVTDILPLSMSRNGLGALAWATHDGGNDAFTTAIRLASFY